MKVNSRLNFLIREIYFFSKINHEVQQESSIHGTFGSNTLDWFVSVPLKVSFQDTFFIWVEQKLNEEEEPVPSDEDRDNV